MINNLDFINAFQCINLPFSSEYGTMPFVVYETAARQLMDSIRDYVQQHNEYADYGQILQKAGIEWNYDSMSEADASILDGKTIVALLIGAVQAEKFCDGAFLGLLKQGCIIRWLGKLEVMPF